MTAARRRRRPARTTRTAHGRHLRVGLLTVLLTGPLTSACTSSPTPATGAAPSTSAAPVRPTNQDRLVDVRMTDGHVEPAAITVPLGATVTFRVTNVGTTTHEAVLGSPAAQAERQRAAASTTAATPTGGTTGAADGGGPAVHDDSHGETGPPEDTVVVPPGGTALLTTTVMAPGTLLLACHRDGWWAAGMQATVTVT